MNLGFCTLRFKHRALDLSCDSFYHLQRYLEKRGIFIPDSKAKLAIDEIYENCLHGPDHPSGIESRDAPRVSATGSGNPYVLGPSNILQGSGPLPSQGIEQTTAPAVSGAPIK